MLSPKVTDPHSCGSVTTIRRHALWWKCFSYGWI